LKGYTKSENIPTEFESNIQVKTRTEKENFANLRREDDKFTAYQKTEKSIKSF